MLDELLAGLDHQKQGRPRQAEAAYQSVLSRDAGQPHALFLLGTLYESAGFLDAAIGLLSRAADARPDHPETLMVLGNALCRNGDLAGGVAQYRMLVARFPWHRSGRVNLARALYADGQAGSAASLCRDTMLRWPGDAELACILATCLLQQGQAEAALDAAERAIGQAPDRAEAWFARGTALSRLGRAEAAFAALTRAVALEPGHAEAALNLGNACLDLDRTEEAERWIRHALSLNPQLKEAHGSLGHLMTVRGRLRDAVAACESAIALDADFAPAHWNLATACLLQGEYERGWAEYEWRKRHQRFAPSFTRPPTPEWTGEALDGRRLLVLAEQGLGDTIQFSRYMPLLAARGARVVLACAPPLHRLLAGAPGVTEVVDRAAAPPVHACWVDQMSLPGLFATRPDNIPAATGWLQADPALASAWRTRLSDAMGPDLPRIGLVWAGNKRHSNDRRRSLPFDRLAPLLARPGLRFASLQIGERAEGSSVVDLSPALTDLQDTAAAIANLDLVVTVDSAVAHLAGALGRPAWLLLPHAPDWRWLLGRDDTPWYASLRLFRQARPGDWDGAIERVQAALTAAYGRACATSCTG